MGGNAFKDLNLVRIQREHIDGTLRTLVARLSFPKLSFPYVKENLMGSAGRQPTSGDLDIALERGEFDLSRLCERCRAVLGDDYVSSKTLKGGQIQTAWPIQGRPQGEFIQVDFILGRTEWLKFSHWSPGEVSAYKGVVISTLLGVLCKVNKDFEAFALDNPDERVARVGLHYDLELGMHRKWEIQRRRGQGLSSFDPGDWETRFGLMMDRGIVPEQKIPYFPRIGYIDTPDDVVRILFGDGVTPADVNTFEKAWAKATLRYPDRVDEIKERLTEALWRSGLKYDMSRDEIANMIGELK